MASSPSQEQSAKRAGSMSDPLWYKDAILYELHVRAFSDSNNDGIGDFPGLLTKLDYLQDLGVTCIWLLPFFPSPLRDDGYDIQDYMGVNPSYGTLDDFKAFLDAAHDRELQVMIELVINHTSDQHPWFQAARLAPHGSPERDFYVWSDTDQKYQDARIIFTDTQKSNWTWDPVAKAYFWHRFFSHQPDLNFDNSRVIEEVIKIMRHWLDMGVDGLRIDAIPYLVEREGTTCENLPETHAVMKRIRAEIDAEYGGRLILAEANQWPTDVRPYFGDGDECHMAFHFPLMPRIYMALRQEDRLPITDIMAQTPDIPDNCQWGLFLRNHDELTLEMVTADERDYMYLAYSADPRMRINIGIRRRLAPLVDNNRRRIELLNSLLFSFPGTPIIYYGDEIGMGDNIYLGDRNGVRTPMQWSGDRNAGFSRANPARLYSPVVMDPVWGYEAVNVEAQQSDQSSLLNWMRNMIALRKLFQVFGRGTLKFLDPANRKILAYIREYEGEQVLCAANLSRFAQPVQLDLAGMEGKLPVEMLGYVEFPVIGRQAYPLTLGPYGFLWLELQPAPVPEVSPEALDNAGIYVASENDWATLLDGAAKSGMEDEVLPQFVQRQRWFGGKSRTVESVRIVDWGSFGARSAFVLAKVTYTAGEPDEYLLPLAMLFGKTVDSFKETYGAAVLTVLTSPQGAGVLHDATYSDDSCKALLALIHRSAELATGKGVIRGMPSSTFERLQVEEMELLQPRRSSAEQSNSSIVFGDRLIMKLFRRQQPGQNPDTEIGRYLSEFTSFEHIAPFEGSIEYSSHDQPGAASAQTIAMLQGLVANEGDGWQWTLEELERYYEDCAPSVIPASQALREEAAREHAGIYLDAAEVLGRRTGELHLALASALADPAFAPGIYSTSDLDELQDNLVDHANRAFDLLRESLPKLPDEVVALAGMVLSRRSVILERLRQTAAIGTDMPKTRIHGDYHLGQVLRTRSDFVILDFEGEPARSLAERRARQSPLKDVAGMLRSFSYAAFAALMKYTARRPEHLERLDPWAKLWDEAVESRFLSAYREIVGEENRTPGMLESNSAFNSMLEVYVLDKALYELTYELNNRPDWVWIPLRGILEHFE
jgi:maltose alpha-D-glucosyltransferase/alpha-amylase